MIINTYGKNQLIFSCGDVADSMFEILSGRVGIYAGYGSDDQKELVVLAAGKTFGEMGMIDNLPRSATAVALDADTRLQVITADSFADYFQTKPEKVLVIMRNMSGRIRGLTEDYINACRAVAEAEEVSRTGARKSAWFLGNVKKFLNDYADAVHATNSMGASGSVYFHDPSLF